MLTKVSASDFQLTSSWACEKAKKKDETVTTIIEKAKKYVISSPPTEPKAVVKFPYSLDSGVRIISARVRANVSHPAGGISALNVNGSSMSKADNGSYYASVDMQTTSGILSVVFSFRASGKVFDDTSRHMVTAFYTNVYLEIEHNGISGESEDETSRKTKGYAVPPQSVCIFDQTDNSIYTFDGVIKVQHSLSMDVQEEPSGDKAKEYVNNVKNQPDKLTLDVMMSDVYTGGGDIISNAGALTAAQNAGFIATKKTLIGRDAQNPWTRSENAFYTLHWLKEERRKLTVITPQYIHTDMILTTVTVNHEDVTPFGWEGQIVFQHAFAKKKQEKKKTSGGGDGDDKIGESAGTQALTWLGFGSLTDIARQMGLT